MSSDEEKQLEKRKLAKKKKSIQQARLEAEKESGERNKEIEKYVSARQGAATRAKETAQRLKRESDEAKA